MSANEVWMILRKPAMVGVLFLRFPPVFIVGLAIFLLPFAPAKADSALETYGDIMQIALPATAAAISLGKEDYNGALKLTAGALVTAGVVMGLKAAVNSERPNGKSQSFPSGQTSAAFSGASYLHYRYG